jgi:hypothetical protein
MQRVTVQHRADRTTPLALSCFVCTAASVPAGLSVRQAKYARVLYVAVTLHTPWACAGVPTIPKDRRSLLCSLCRIHVRPAYPKARLPARPFRAPACRLPLAAQTPCAARACLHFAPSASRTLRCAGHARTRWPGCYALWIRPGRCGTGKGPAVTYNGPAVFKSGSDRPLRPADAHCSTARASSARTPTASPRSTRCARAHTASP